MAKKRKENAKQHQCVRILNGGTEQKIKKIQMVEYAVHGISFDHTGTRYKCKYAGRCLIPSFLIVEMLFAVQYIAVAYMYLKANRPSSPCAVVPMLFTLFTEHITWYS